MNFVFDFKAPECLVQVLFLYQQFLQYTCRHFLISIKNAKFEINNESSENDS